MSHYRRLAKLLVETDDVLARWSRAFQHTGLIVPGGPSARDMRPMVTSIVEELRTALAVERDLPDGLAPGSAVTRELEKAAAFAGASMAALGASGFDIAAALLALRDVLTAAESRDLERLEQGDAAAVPVWQSDIGRVFEWLTVIALDAYAKAGVSAERERQRVQLEHHTPVVMVTPFLPAVLLIGSPDRVGLDAIFSRLLLSVVRVGARVAIVDATGLTDPTADEVVDSLRGFVNHRKISTHVDINAVGLDREHADAWSRLCRDAQVGFRHVERFADAVDDAFARLCYELRRLPDE